MTKPPRYDPPDPPPTPENQNLVRDLGLFHVTWSILDMMMDAGIMKLLRLNAEEAAIVCSGLPFERKSSILQSLMSLRKPALHEGDVLLVVPSWSRSIRLALPGRSSLVAAPTPPSNQ